MTLLVQFAWLMAFAWLLGAALTLAVLARRKFLKPVDDARLTTGDAPSVSVLIPARNEESRVLPECVRSVLAQDYGRFEVIAVDDRSTDATPRLLRSLARDDARLNVIEGRELPAGWLGKPHALAQALEASRGEWVLTTDADVVFHPSALRAAIGYALAHDCDAVSLVPHFEAHTFWERVFIPTWAWGMLVLFPADFINRRRTRLALGLGAFFLVRRSALLRLGGFEAVRAEVIEDMRLAEKLKRSGAYLRAEHAPALIRTRMYTNFRELRESATKNLFAALKFSRALALAYVVWTFMVGVLPPVLLVLSALMILVGAGGGAWRELLLPSFAAWAMQAALLSLVSAGNRVPRAYALTAPLGFALACLLMSESALAVTTRRGVTWKGRKIYERTGVRPPRS